MVDISLVTTQWWSKEFSLEAKLFLVVAVEAAAGLPAEVARVDEGAEQVGGAEALAVSGLSMDALAASGRPPERAMAELEAWLGEVVPPDQRPVMVGFNAPFDWLFVNAYFWRYLGRNPFGHAALDLKALYMGVTGCGWRETGMARVAARYGIEGVLPHHAGEDARYQAMLMRHILAERARRTGEKT